MAQQQIKTPKQIFIDDRIGQGCDREDVLWLADLQFTENGDVRPGSIFEAYLGIQ